MTYNKRLSTTFLYIPSVPDQCIELAARLFSIINERKFDMIGAVFFPSLMTPHLQQNLLALSSIWVVATNDEMPSATI